MSGLRRPHVNPYSRNRLRRLCGLEDEYRGSWGCTTRPPYVDRFAIWHDTRKPGKDLCDRVFCAFLLVEDMPLAVQIGNRTKTLEEAIERAKAMAMLKETGSA